MDVFMYDGVEYIRNPNGTWCKTNYEAVLDGMKDRLKKAYRAENPNKVPEEKDSGNISIYSRIHEFDKKHAPHTLRAFTIYRNQYLTVETAGYHREDYTKYKDPGNPDFINYLKNTFNDCDTSVLENAKNKVIDILEEDLPQVMKENGLSNCVIVAIPRAKRYETYTRKQLMLIEAISEAAEAIPGAEDGTQVIHRHTNTKTTHLGSEKSRYRADGIRELNTGDPPYPGITKKTCTIDASKVKGKNVILIDDIYTKTINIDEDAIQALLDNGAKRVVFYAIAKTKGRYE